MNKVAFSKGKGESFKLFKLLVIIRMSKLKAGFYFGSVVFGI